MVSIGISRRREEVFPMVEHVVRVSGSEVTGLGVEVGEDCIRLPAPEGADSHFIDAGDEQGGGSTRMEAVGFDACRWDVGDVLNISCSCPEFLGDDGGGDLLWHAIGVKVGVQGGLMWCPMLSEMEDLALSGTNRTEGVVSR